ncbi:hypothetical protein [Phaffia rhodozyma]|uniref:Uncharacterized protein n=1 Tax=Phaffia rhodozyma TaxID=264483 RepID=A0A0F7SH48_PHARH|nr:hypothetical protein [Phaffia rhodozyma]
MADPSGTAATTESGVTGTSATQGLGGGTTSTSGGDFLDKGVDYAATKSGHTQSHGTVEKISDGIRSGFKKMTGKDVPIADKTYQ